MNLSEKMDAQLFHDKDVRELLAEMPEHAITARYGDPRVVTVYSRPMPESKPALASEDPAVVQAMGRCAVARMRSTLSDRLHPATCSWCDYPVEQLVAACEWGEWQSRYLTAEVLIWRGAEGATYERGGRSSGYTNPEWIRFWALPVKERERRIEAVA